MFKHISTDRLRELYLSFFESKGHKRIASAPLVPTDDPSVLFTTAGMHPLVPYLKGAGHPAGRRLVDVQKCLRTTDIDAVGDAVHATVFEMLGNWSLGDYFKQEAIKWSWEFLTDKAWLGIDPKYLAVSVFAGDSDAPRDQESAGIWQSLGMPLEHIAYLSKEDNWWPAGGKHPGPQGPDTEMFYWVGKDSPAPVFDPNDKNWVEIWNNVFMQYNRTGDGRYEELPQKNVDTGMGLERTVMVLNGLKSIYDIDVFADLMAVINANAASGDMEQKRILADHIKAFTFILADEVPVVPGNTDQGYVARRLIRRAVLAHSKLKIEDKASDFLSRGMELIIKQYGEVYPSLKKRRTQATRALKAEVTKFDAAFDRGLKEFDKLVAGRASGGVISGREAFRLYETYGFPVEVTQELARGLQLTVDRPAADQALASHQQKSRTAAAGKFKGGLADHSEKSVHYHTATHLLHQSLRSVLGEHVRQRGSNITAARLRFDFSHPVKMTGQEIKKVEDLVNEQIEANLPVARYEMSVSEAKKLGALGLFAHKYGEKVSVYIIGDFSREICGGPHVTQTGALGKFRITKEESAGAGLRRIKAKLE